MPSSMGGSCDDGLTSSMCTVSAYFFFTFCVSVCVHIMTGVGGMLGRQKSKMTLVIELQLCLMKLLPNI